MKNTLLLLLLTFLFKISFSQPLVGYYNSANGLSGYTLKSALSNIITNGHIPKSYNNLYNGYQNTDSDWFYDNDGSVLDVYSEIPSGVDSFYYNHNSQTCGNYSGEGDCYNREHLIPQSIFNSSMPMYSDIHFVIPTDGYVNGQRSNLPFGEVANPSWTSVNGSKKGNNTFSAFYSGQVFEPIDEFKGDVARSLLYFATRYENNVTSWTYNNVFDGTTTQVYTDWFINLLLSWHENDPVSAREISRNNACYSYQGNRNPYIDSAQYVELIWGKSDIIKPTSPLNLTVSNISTDSAVLTWNSSFDSSGIMNYTVYTSFAFPLITTNDTTVTLHGLNPATTYGYYVQSIDLRGNISLPSNTVTFTTDTAYASINEYVFNNLSIYPNPSSNGLVTVKNSFNITNVSLYSVVGDKVKSFSTNKTEEKIDVGDLPKGVYFVKVKSKGTEVTKRILIN